jgi:hypothetical protein
MEESKETNKDWWDDLSESQKQHIQEGLEDVRQGRVMSSAEFWDRLKKDGN